MNFLSIIQKAINHYLALDPESKKRLHKLQGKMIEIELLGLALNFQLLFDQSGIKVASDKMMNPDTVIKGTPLSLLRMTLTRGDRKKFFSDDISIEGDLELGQQVIDLFDQLEIDWEEHLAQKIGDVSAHHLSRLVRDVKKWCEYSRESLVRNINEYIHEEKTWFPQRELLQEFFDEIDTLRMDVDRLEASIKKLRQI